MCYISGNLNYFDKIKIISQKLFNLLEFSFQNIYDRHLQTTVIKLLTLIYVSFLGVRFEVALGG